MVVSPTLPPPLVYLPCLYCRVYIKTATGWLAPSLSNKCNNTQQSSDYSSDGLSGFSMKATKRCYQADAKDSAKMTMMEPSHFLDEPKAQKKTQPELKLDKPNGQPTPRAELHK